MNKSQVFEDEKLKKELEFENSIGENSLENSLNSIQYGEKLQSYEIYFPHNNLIEVLNDFRNFRNENKRKKNAQ